MPITPLYASLFAIIYVYLSLNVIKHRFSKKNSVASGGDESLNIAIRIHGNFIEYVPISLILFWFIEVIAFASYWVVILGSVLLLARIAHIIGMNDTKNMLIFRQIGMVATFAVILISAAILIWHYLPVLI